MQISSFYLVETICVNQYGGTTVMKVAIFWGDRKSGIKFRNSIFGVAKM